MKLSKETLCKMEFNDHFAHLEPEKDEESDEKNDNCCMICGTKLENLKIGFNEKEQLFRYECTNCDSVYITTESNAREDRVLLKGEHRNWPEYLMEKLKFPFEVMIIEESEKAFFVDDYDGPRIYDIAKVFEVFYSMKYGVEALIRIGRKKHRHLLAWVEVLDKSSSNYVEIENYKRWRERYWLSDYLVAILGVIG